MRILIFISIFVLCANLSAQDTEASFLNASQMYQEGNYAQSLKIYKDIENAGLQSADLYYNLGNTYYKLDSIGQSILNYERALRLSPNDSEIHSNIELARTKLEYKASAYPLIFYKQWFKTLINTLGSLFWMILGLALIWLAFWLAYKFIYSNSASSKKKLFFSGMLVAFLSFLCLIFAWTKYGWETNRDYAIISYNTVQVKTAPSDDSQTQFRLSPGNKVYVEEVFEEWTKIILEDEKEGWVPSGNITRI